MAKFQCRRCSAFKIYRSKFKASDIPYLFLGFPVRCHHCNMRFYTWRFTPAPPPREVEGESDREKSGN